MDELPDNVQRQSSDLVAPIALEENEMHDDLSMSSNEHLSLETEAKIKTKRRGFFNNKVEMSYEVNSALKEDAEDSNSFVLSTSLPDDSNGAQFESFSCTDEDSQIEEEDTADDTDDESLFSPNK